MTMIDSFLIALGIVSAISLGLLFLPAIVELKKPKDSGPRLITGFFGQNRSSAKKTSLVIIEDGLKIGCQLASIEDYSSIQKMEA